MVRKSTAESPPHRMWRGALYVLLLIAPGGCMSFSQAKASHDKVVQSRQLTQQGVQAMHRDDWPTAVSLLSEAKRNTPYDIQTRIHYAESLWNTSKQAEAIAELQETLDLASDDPELHTRLGRMYLEAGEPTQAHISANRAIDCDPKFAAAWKLQGDLAHLRRDLAGAKLCYIRAATYSDAVDPEVQLRLAATYRQMGQPSQALACISLIQQAHLGQRLPAEVGIEQALAFRDQQRPLEAADRLGQLADDGELTPDLLYVWAECEITAGRLARAEFAANEALRLDPQHAPALQLVGRLPDLRQQAKATWQR